MRNRSRYPVTTNASPANGDRSPRRLFPGDHFCEILRDTELPTPSQVKRSLAKRCAWLIKKIEERVKLGGDARIMEDELAAIVVAIDAYVQARGDSDSEAFRARLARESEVLATKGSES